MTLAAARSRYIDLVDRCQNNMTHLEPSILISDLTPILGHVFFALL